MESVEDYSETQMTDRGPGTQNHAFQNDLLHCGSGYVSFYGTSSSLPLACPVNFQVAGPARLHLETSGPGESSKDKPIGSAAESVLTLCLDTCSL